MEAVNLGFGHKTDFLTITFAKDNRSGGYVSDKIRPDAGHVTEEIRIDTLDSFFMGKNELPSFLKIDVEGFEQNVIQGGRIFLENARPTVVMEMNHFCLDVLQKVTIPDFLDFMRSVFPYLYAVDTDNQTIVDLHVPELAYMVMHEHVVKNRFPNLVGGFDAKIKKKLDSLANEVKRPSAESTLQTLENKSTDKLSKASIGQLQHSNRIGKIEPLCDFGRINAGEAFEIFVRVSNDGHETWAGYGDHPVFLCYHWKDTDDSNLIFDGTRTAMDNADLPAGQTMEQNMKVVVPNRKGVYRLFLTLVQEGVCWFEDKGFKGATLDIAVV